MQLLCGYVTASHVCNSIKIQTLTHSLCFLSFALRGFDEFKGALFWGKAPKNNVKAATEVDLSASLSGMEDKQENIRN